MGQWGKTQGNTPGNVAKMRSDVLAALHLWRQELVRLGNDMAATRAGYIVYEAVQDELRAIEEAQEGIREALASIDANAEEILKKSTPPH